MLRGLASSGVERPISSSGRVRAMFRGGSGGAILGVAEVAHCGPPILGATHAAPEGASPAFTPLTRLLTRHTPTF